MGFIEEIERRRQQEAKQELDRQAERERQRQIASQETLAKEEGELRESQRKGQIFIKEANDLVGIQDRFNPIFQGHKGYFRDVAKLSGFRLTETIYMTYPRPIPTLDEHRNDFKVPYYSLDKNGSEFTRQQIQVKRELDRRLVASGLFSERVESQRSWSRDKNYLADEDKEWLWAQNWGTKDPNTRFWGDNIVESVGSRSTKRGLDESQEVGIGIYFFKKGIEEHGRTNILAEVLNRPYNYSIESWDNAVYIRIVPPGVAIITGSTQRRLDLGDIRQFDRNLAEAFQNPAVVYSVRNERWEPPERKPRSSSYYSGPSLPEGPCLPGFVLISSPMGLIPIKNLKVGDFVWTVDKFGRKKKAKIIQKCRRAVPKNHKIVHLILKDGREVFVSAYHPAIDSKPVISLKKGQFFDNSFVLSISLIPYNDKYTYDILPAGDTGGYWANNILLGSTLYSINSFSSVAENELLLVYPLWRA